MTYARGLLRAVRIQEKKTANKITYDLYLCNKIYKANLDTLTKICQSGIKSIRNREEEFIQEIVNWNYTEYPTPNKNFTEIQSELNNLDWILLNSLFIASFSFFEHHIYSLASIVEDRVLLEIKIKDINGKGVEQYRKYLHLIGKLPTADNSSTGNSHKEWQAINLFQKVRNKLAHNGGMIITDPTQAKNLEREDIFKFLSQYKAVMAGSMGIIRIKTTELIGSFNTLTSALSDKLVTEINDMYKDN